MERVNYEAILECLSKFSCKNTYLYVNHAQAIHFLAQFSDFGEPGAENANFQFKFDSNSKSKR